VTWPEHKERLQALISGPGGEQKILAYAHCYQKALGTSDQVLEMLRLLPGTDVEQIDCGCCGMAGSFGYEKEHYELSMAIGEQALSSAIRAASPGTMIAAAGTSCREQIKDGTQRLASHPVEIIARAIDSSKA
jgi:Fe-S oxidoreductase